MELLPTPTDDALSEFVHQEPFRLARTLPLIATRFTPPRTPGVLQSRDRLLQRLDAALNQHANAGMRPRRVRQNHAAVPSGISIGSSRGVRWPG
ncbi:hypothetical protein [Raoultella ornithinolytica]|uniref:hypothetical protein n=1 Tax=Raoultella ornithinolytica TaxID=54291 RepID=UPI00359021E4